MNNKFIIIIAVLLNIIHFNNVNIHAESVLNLDVDKDEKVTSSDALLILQNVVGVDNTLDVQSADADNDGKITSSDALVILQYVVGIYNEENLVWEIEPSIEADNIYPLISRKYNSRYFSDNGYNYKYSIIEQNGLKGIIDTNGKIKIPVIYNTLEYCDICGLVYADDTKYIYVDEYSIFAITDNVEGHGLILNYPKWDIDNNWCLEKVVEGIYEPDGVYMCTAVKDVVYTYANNYLDYDENSIVETGKYGIVNLDTNEILTDFVYDELNYSSLGVPNKNNIYSARQGDKWIYIDAYNNPINDEVYEPINFYNNEYIYTFAGDYTAVKQNGKMGIINAEGQIVIPISYSSIAPVVKVNETYSSDTGYIYDIENTKFWIEVNGKWGLIDISDNIK